MISEDFALTCVQMISNSGSAKSCYIEALQKAKSKEYEEAEKLMQEGDDFFAQAHEVHGTLLQKEASGEKVEFALILMHAEDQMASTELAKVLARELIELYQKTGKEPRSCRKRNSDCICGSFKKRRFKKRICCL